MEPFAENIEQQTLDNEDYRRVAYTVPGSMQLVYMSILPGDDIPMEVHPNTTQFIRIESGIGIAEIDGVDHALADGVSVIIPPGAEHRIENSGYEPLKLYTIYTPPEHPEGLVEKTKPMTDDELRRYRVDALNRMLYDEFVDSENPDWLLETTQRVLGEDVCYRINKKKTDDGVKELIHCGVGVFVQGSTDEYGDLTTNVYPIESSEDAGVEVLVYGDVKAYGEIEEDVVGIISKDFGYETSLLLNKDAFMAQDDKEEVRINDQLNFVITEDLLSGSWSYAINEIDGDTIWEYSDDEDRFSRLFYRSANVYSMSGNIAIEYSNGPTIVFMTSHLTLPLTKSTHKR